MHTYVHVYGHTHSHTHHGGDQQCTSQRVFYSVCNPLTPQPSHTFSVCVRVNARRVCYRHASLFSVLTRLLRPLKSGVLICKSSHARSLAHCARAHALLHTHTQIHTHKHTNTTHIPTWDYIHSSRCSSISVGQAGSTLLCVIFSQRL